MRREPRGFVEVRFRLLHMAGALQRQAELEVRARIVRRQADGFAELLDRAREILAFLEKQHVPEANPSGPIRKVKTGRALQNSLFAALPDPLLDELRQIETIGITPDQALALLKRLRELAD